MPPYGSFSVYFVYNMISPFKPRKVFFFPFSDDFCSHCSGFIFRNFPNLMPILHIYYFLSQWSSVFFYFNVEEHLKTAFHIWVKILKSQLWSLHSPSEFSCNPLLFHLTPFLSLLVLYLWLTTPSSYMPHFPVSSWVKNFIIRNGRNI